MTPARIETNPLYLSLGATATVEPAFTGDLAWYADCSARHAADGAEGRLVTMHTFHQSWTSWEMHPHGAEVVLCVDGSLTLIQQVLNGALTRLPLTAGEYAINPAGVWHTADIESHAKALFITAGLGTQNRPR